MARLPLVKLTNTPYHVTGRANNRDPFPGHLKSNWKVFGEHLNEIAQRFDSRIHAFVLMPNHFHLLLTTPREDLGQTMQYFMRATTQHINRLTHRSGRIFGAKYFRNIVDSTDYFDCVTKYIYRNPVKAGISFRIEDYQFSSFKGVVSPSDLPFSLSPPDGEKSLVPSGDLLSYLSWLNIPFRSEEDIEIRKAIKRPYFKPPSTYKSFRN